MSKISHEYVENSRYDTEHTIPNTQVSKTPLFLICESLLYDILGTVYSSCLSGNQVKYIIIVYYGVVQ